MATNEIAKEQAMNVIHDKVDGLLRERREIRQQRAKIEERDRAIDRDLADCVAAARVFGVKLELPAEPKEHSALDVLFNWTARTREQTRQDLNRAMAIAAEVKPSAPVASGKTPMPKVRDIVLDQLKLAGAFGTKATPIRDYIERTYNKDLHWKTVGMTLYRLSKDGLAHRKGQTWFFGPPPSEAETKNPGVAAPGLNLE